MKIVEQAVFDEERALYGACDTVVRDCRFEGEADGESALKESRRVTVDGCYFALRYPFWHCKELSVKNTEMTDTCRAPLWYSENIVISDARLFGTKALRECQTVKIENTRICSDEFGWSVADLRMTDSEAEGAYFLLRAKKLFLKNLRFSGKYSFQYIENAVLENCVLDTKDAFWHAKNVTVRDSVVRGEYLGWYSEGLTLIRCKITGTQPLCYAKRLRLIDCEMEAADLAFEKSSVRANVFGHIDSIKNPRRGKITADSVGEIIRDERVSHGAVVIKQTKGELQ